MSSVRDEGIAGFPPQPVALSRVGWSGLQRFGVLLPACIYDRPLQIAILAFNLSIVEG
jgi:hypothetical protein